jgi:hypothetical protein
VNKKKVKEKKEKKEGACYFRHHSRGKERGNGFSHFDEY